MDIRNMASLHLISGERMLLLYRIGSRVISDCYTGSAGGHFIEEELNNARACVLRELQEETGLTEQDVENLALRYVTLRLKNGEIRQNYYFFAGLKDPDREITSNEGNLRWVDFEETSALNMPFTAEYVVKHYLSIGRYTTCIYGGLATRNGVQFAELEEF